MTMLVQAQPRLGRRLENGYRLELLRPIAELADGGRDAEPMITIDAK